MRNEMQKKIDLKKRMQQIRFTTEFTLSEDQAKRLMQDKFERYKNFSSLYKALKERTLHPQG